MHQDQYDIVIVGGGMGGLMSACILSDEGYKVCLIDRNKQLGGNLQTFSRDKEIFDTGVHYIGGLNKGQNLHQIFSYLGIMNNLKLKKMDEDGFDHISFDQHDKVYKLAQGYDHFRESLIQQFPSQKEGVDSFIGAIRDTLQQFPMYHLDEEGEYDFFNPKLNVGAKDFLDRNITDPMLSAVLSGNSMVYAGKGSTTPFYMLALILNTYIESSWKCMNGGSQIAIQLTKRIREHGGTIIKKQRVNQLVCEDHKVSKAILEDGRSIYGNNFISNIHPVDTMHLLVDAPIKKAYRNRILNMQDTISVFSIYLTIKPGALPYMNHNIYHFRKPNPWETGTDSMSENWPECYMVSTTASTTSVTKGYATGMTIMVYMSFDEVVRWKDSFNTVAKEKSRGAEYESFKTERADKVLYAVEKRIPGLRAAVQSMYTSSPLSYRDYIGSDTGSLYGIEKDYNAPWRSFLGSRSKIPNLMFVGQNVVMHGILGVAIGTVLTCSEFIGKKYLVRKIKSIY
ncbi:MAG: NAD(P)/FAD-dependent oxidoreductase [Bacteroidetes bacterium]|nr:NAD(P)/FAD-dependent oxidoreductase [Bacteroidota bacterium]